MISSHFSRKVARQSGSNFYWSFFFLPHEKRSAIFTIYAFSRLIDDAVDEIKDQEKARLEIGLWRERIKLCFRDNADREIDPALHHPLLEELSHVIHRFRIPNCYFQDLLTGVEMDLLQKRYETFEELETYCYYVAGTVGLLCNHLFGFQEELGRRYAVLLGTAFQLTNILRDVGSDADRGRLYLPREDLTRFGLTDSDILERRGGEAASFLKMMRFEAERAEAFFQKAFGALSTDIRKRLLPSEIMSAFYHRILRRLQEENFPVYERKVSLSLSEKVGLVVKTVVQSKIGS